MSDELERWKKKIEGLELNPAVFLQEGQYEPRNNSVIKVSESGELVLMDSVMAENALLWRYKLPKDWSEHERFVHSYGYGNGSRETLASCNQYVHSLIREQKLAHIRRDKWQRRCLESEKLADYWKDSAGALSDRVIQLEKNLNIVGKSNEAKDDLIRDLYAELEEKNK